MLKRMMMVAGVLLALGGVAHAEAGCDAARPGENKQQEFQRLLDCTRQSILDAKVRLNFLSDMKMEELEAGLERERDILNGLIETRNAALNAANDDNTKLKAANDELTRQLDTANQKNEEANARIAALQAEVERLAADLNTANITINISNGKITALQAVIDQLQAQLTELNDNLKAAKEQQETLAAKIDELTKKLDDANNNVTTQAQALGKQINDLEAALGASNNKIAALGAQIDQLTTDLADAKTRIADLSAKLDATTTALNDANQKIAALEKEIADLMAKLQEAIDKVCALTDRLGPYAVDFVTGLHALFPGNQDVFVVDNRLVIAAEVLFPSGKDVIEPAGQVALRKAADFMKTFDTNIPADVPWLIQINGHTDLRPIHTKRFPTNWELSTARAIAVVNFLHGEQIPYDRLAAAGYSQYHPIAAGKDAESLHRNRRIEIQLTGNGAFGTNSTGCAK